MSAFKFNAGEIKTALKDLNGVFRLISYVFLVPIPLSIYDVFISSLVAGVGPLPLIAAVFKSQPGDLLAASLAAFSRSLIFLIPAAVSYSLHRYLRGFETRESFKAKHVMLAVSIGWLMISLIGMLPFLLGNTLPPLDSWFESMSGWSTTGLSMIHDLEATPRDILLYRSLMQWVGGVGIVVMALAVFFRKGDIASTYYSSERGEVRIRPSIRGTVAETWKIYVVYTIACIVLLNLAGMGLFDSINHSMVTLATGGFSTHNDSIAFFSDKPLVEVFITLFMIIGSVSFLIHFRLFDGDIRFLLNNIEFRFMVVLVLISTLLISSVLYLETGFQKPTAFADALFQGVSALSCTGLSTVDLSSWSESELPSVTLVLLMFFGGIYGSTAGGIKLLRLVVMLKVISYSVKKLMLPRTAIVRIKLGGAAIDGGEIISVFAISALYLSLAAAGSIILMLTDFTAIQAVFITFSSMSNVGLSNIPSGDWFGMSDLSKLIIIVLMWVGRLEIFPVLVTLKALFVKKRSA